MAFPVSFISAAANSATDYSTYSKHVPAPYMRKSFVLSDKPDKAEILVCGLGFYKLYVNGKDITKGALAPYISNPDDIIYYDKYDVAALLEKGENVIGLILGNGMQNAPGGKVWDFDLARFRAAPRAALRLDATIPGNDDFSLETDESFRVHPSPIFFDELRSGVFYDAQNEIPGWSCKGFDDSGWNHAVICEKARGEARLCEADPIVCAKKLPPVDIKKSTLADYTPSEHMKDIVTQLKNPPREGWLYDFGVNSAGTVELNITGKPGQRIDLQFCEFIDSNGNPSCRNIDFYPEGYSQHDIYICAGGKEKWTPDFTYHGFRYCLVSGLEDEQATPELLTYLVMHSDIEDDRGSFECSDATANAIQQAARRSDLANFYYFPTDCPHREKNGWTGDASMSCEHMLLNLSPEDSYREWLRNIRKAQREDGSIPGIVPTAGWGYAWGNGPTWDSVLTWIPYYTYLYRGDKEILKENSQAIFRYIDYISRHISDDGLVRLGLGDWLPVGRNAGNYKSPLEVTDTLMSMSICMYAEKIFNVLGLSAQADFAHVVYSRLRSAARKRLIMADGATVLGRCQTSQAVGIYFNLFDRAEKPAAYRVLKELISEADGHFDVGMIGIRVIFHVLAEFGDTELAYKMITRPDFPSYGNLIKRGATSLWESFWPENTHIDSLNHHFFGDVSNFFITKIAGLIINPYGDDPSEVDVRPAFVSDLNYACAHYNTVSGRIEVRWERKKDKVALIISAADGVSGKIYAPDGYVFESEEERFDSISVRSLESGTFCFRKI